MQEISLVIADDHPLFRSGVVSVLEKSGKYKVISETGNGSEALELILKFKPDAAILDFQMPDMNGIEITEKLKELNSSVKVILLTMHDAKKIFFKALDAGVKGYILKDDAVLEIVNAIESVTAGNEYISKSLVNVLVKKAITSSGNNKIVDLLTELTVTEHKILALIADLKTNDEISDILFISKRTIENHKVSISKKLQLNSSRDLFKFGVQYSEYIKKF